MHWLRRCPCTVTQRTGGQPQRPSVASGRALRSTYRSPSAVRRRPPSRVLVMLDETFSIIASAADAAASRAARGPDRGRIRSRKPPPSTGSPRPRPDPVRHPVEVERNVFEERPNRRRNYTAAAGSRRPPVRNRALHERPLAIAREAARTERVSMNQWSGTVPWPVRRGCCRRPCCRSGHRTGHERRQRKPGVARARTSQTCIASRAFLAASDDRRRSGRPPATPLRPRAERPPPAETARG